MLREGSYVHNTCMEGRVGVAGVAEAVSQRQVCLVVPSPVHNHCYCPRLLGVVQGGNLEHLFHSRRQSIIKHHVLINVVDNTRTVTPVPSDGPRPSGHP